MKKLFKNSICIFIAVITLFSFNAYAESVKPFAIPESYKLIMCEGSKIGIAGGEFSVLSSVPVSADGNLMLPVRYLFEAMGYSISYDNGKCELSGEKEITLNVESNIISVDGAERALSTQVKNIEGGLYAPSDIADVFGLKTKRSSNGLFVLYSGSYEDKCDEHLLNLQGIYVAKNGNKAGNGRVSNPVDSMESAELIAEEYAKNYGKSYPIHIFVKGGTYRFSKTIKFDSGVFGGENFKGVKVIGYGGEVEFTGSTELPVEKLKPVTDAATLLRLPKAGRGKVAYLDLSELGITSIKKKDSAVANNDPFPYIYLNDKQQQNARWPNSDYATVKSVPARGVIGYGDVNCNRWAEADDLFVTGFFGTDYDYRRSKIQSIDTESMTLTQRSGEYMMPTGSGVGKRWYASNLLEEIDVPGEWYVDRTKNILYFYPPYTLKDSKLEIVTLFDTMFELNSCRNFKFSNIKFAKTGGRCFEITKINGLTVKDCEFNYIELDCLYGRNIYNVTLTGNETYLCHRAFIDMTAGNIVTADWGNLKIENNRIINMGIYPQLGNSPIFGRLNAPERDGSMGVEVNNNVLQDNVNATGAVQVNGSYISVHHNEIVNHARHIKDGGAIYVGRTNSFRNNDFSFNYLHEFNKDNFFCALYSDDGQAGGYWHHNVTNNINRLCIVGAGTDTQYMYNLAINSKVAGTVGDRMSWSAALYGDGGQFQQEVETALSYQEYADAFPELKEALKRSPYFAPYNGVYFGNVGVNSTGESGAYGIQEQMATYGAKTIERNGETFSLDGLNSTQEGNKGYVYSDDYFKDPENEIWDIKEESQIAKDYPELLEIKVEDIGIEDEYSHLLENNDSFKLKYPSNGLTGIQPANIRFSWELMKGAGKYRLVVATDPELTNPVIDEIVYPDGDDVRFETDALELDSVYYWKVYAIGMARQSKFTKESDGVPYCFKTAKKEEFSKDNLKYAIDTLKKFSDSITDGGYKYEQEFTDDLKEMLDKSEEIYRASANQDEVDSMEEEIYTFIKRSPFYLEIEYKQPSFVTDKNSEWKTLQKIDETVIKYSNDELTIAPTGIRGWMATKSDIENEVLCFQVKFDDIPLTASKYQGFDFKMENDVNRGYLFIIKQNIFEMQTSHGTYYKALPNFNIKPGEWYEFQFGAINTPGGVLWLCSVDGKLIFAELDQSVNQVNTGGRFAVRTNADNTIHIRPSQNIPEKGSLIDRIYSEWEKVDNIDYYSCLLDGTSTALGIDSSLYSSIDKTKLAEKLWEDVKSGELKFDRSDYKAYVDKIFEKAVLEAYNQGKTDVLLKNGLVHLYNDYVHFESIDENGVTLHSFSQKRLSDSDKMNINTSLSGGDCNSFSELRQRYARQIFVQSINSFGSTFAADASYMFDVFTEANMNYIGFDISEYMTLSDSQKEYVHTNLGGETKSGSLTYEKITEVFNSLVAEIK